MIDADAIQGFRKSFYNRLKVLALLLAQLVAVVIDLWRLSEAGFRFACSIIGTIMVFPSRQRITHPVKLQGKIRRAKYSRRISS